MISASAASARTKSFVINGSDLRAPNGGAVNAGAETIDGVALGGGGFGQLSVNFTLPKDYKKNSPVVIALRIFGGGTSCVVRFYPNAVARYRNNTSKTIGLADTGQLTADGPIEFARPADFNLVLTRTYKLRKAGTGALVIGSIRDQRAKDYITLVFTRHATTGSDTCSDALIINSAKITYTTN